MDIADYIEERLKRQQDWYMKKATMNKRLFMRFQTAVIILGALIPLLVVFEQIIDYKDWAGPASAVISAIIAVLAGLDKLRQPQTNWFNYRANEEMLKKEQWMHEFKAGPYRHVKQTEADKLFVERVESIISADIARLSQAERKEENGEGDVDRSPKPSAVPPPSPRTPQKKTEHTDETESDQQQGQEPKKG